MTGKTQQLQIRISAPQKAAIQRAATRAGMDVSAWVLARLLPPAAPRFQELTQAIAALRSDPDGRRFAFAELNDFLAGLAPGELSSAMLEPPPADADPYAANYIAAMVETAAHRNRLPPPTWVESITPLAAPVFGAPFSSLRLHLLTAAPPAFRRRNIFIDASIGARV